MRGTATARFVQVAPPSTRSTEDVELAHRRAQRREEHARVVRRRRLVALAVLFVVLVLLALLVSSIFGSSGSSPRPVRTTATRNFAVGLRVMRFVDRSRTITLPNGTTEPRTLVTYVRYPALGASGATDVSGAPAASADGPYPLVIFGPGFARAPSVYASLLQSWARAGYVVAAPEFPVEGPDAPGGPNESDLPNQPADMRFLITQLLAGSAAATGPLHGLIRSSEVAVGGHSDGGDSALALAFDPTYRDPRVRAAVVLSGAEIPSAGEFEFPQGGPALLATQGTADTISLPSDTYTYYAAAKRPKYLLRLVGATHVAPYSYQEPQLAIVKSTTVAFLNAYLKNTPGALRALASAGHVPGVATLQAEP